ncbi:MAG: S9 family peptidase [Krumholzibacteria bacterium]|nr:S9 family peptidase [Candidatus Krumholzibacteria bacterium]
MPAPLRLIALLVVLLVAAVAAAAEAPPFTLARFLEVPVITSPAVSPDGRLVAYLVTWRDLDQDRRETRLWLADTARGTTRQLTFTNLQVGGLAWRPDGSLSFLRKDDDDATQVWVNPLDGAEPRPVTSIEGGVGAYWWSPDGSRLAVLADPPAPAKDDSASAEGDARDLPVYPVPADRADWEVRDRLELPQEYQQLYVLEAGADHAGAEPLTRAPWHPHHAAWSPDGRQLAVTFNARFSSLVDEDQQIALVDAATGEAEVITPADRHASLAAYSPDGRQLAYYQDREAALRAYLNLKDVVVRDLDDGAARVVTAGSQLTLGGSGSTPATAPVWDQGGRALYLPAAEGTRLDLVRVDTKDQKIAWMTGLEGNLADFGLGGGTVAVVESALHRPGSLLVGKPGGRLKELATTDGSVAAYGLLPARKLRLPGHAGGFVEAFLFLPPGAGEGDRLPAVIEMHGGPYSRYGNAWSTRYPWQVLSREGFAVVIVNPRGGTGYGQDFLRGVYRNFGTDDFLDIMAAVDALVEQGTIDPDRLGFTGYSYGGLMTNAVISRTDRFKAAVSIAGIWNYTSAMGQNNPQLFIDSYDRAWDQDLQLLWEHSPASRAGAITTPTLIMHGTEDEPVDPRQSVEMFSYLQLNGVPSRLVLYPGEGHGINKPSHMIDYQTRELQWFRHYLLGDQDAEGAEVPVPVEP